MSLFLEYSIIGVASGGVYALMALGFVLVFKGTGVFNFAQGELMMLGAYVFFTANQLAGLHWIASLGCTALAGMAAGFLIERGLLRRLTGQPILSVVMATVGLGLALRGAAGLIWGQEQRAMPALLPRAPIFFGDMMVPGTVAWTFVISIAVVVACLAYYRYTRGGITMRAAASSQINALVVGINVPAVSALTWGLAAVVGGFGGVLMAAINDLTPHLGDLALGVLAVLIVGGLDSLAGDPRWWRGDRLAAEHDRRLPRRKVSRGYALCRCSHCSAGPPARSSGAQGDRADMNLLGPRVGVAPVDYRQAARILDSGERRLGAVLLAALLIVFPFVADDYLIYMACVASIAIVSVVGLNVLTGYTGLLSIGHATFNGIGAYACAIASDQLGLSFLVAIPLGGCAAAAAGVIVGLPSLRIKGLYLAIATLAAQYVFLFLAQHWVEVTGGDRGLEVAPARLGHLAFDSDARLYALIVPVTALMCLAAHNLFRTNVGRAFIAVRDRDYSAEVLGIDLLRTKLLAFAIASFYGGIAGALMAYFFRVVNPEQYTFTASIFQLTAVIVGGLGSILGSILGAVFMVALPELLKSAAALLAGADSTRMALILASARELAFGLLIIGFLLFEPFGLAEIARRVRAAMKLWPFRT